MAPPPKLDPAVILALGLSTAATTPACIGPCLKYAETGDTDSDSDSDTDTDTDTDSDAAALTPEDATERVLDRGVLPDDVAELVRSRTG